MVVSWVGLLMLLSGLRIPLNTCQKPIVFGHLHQYLITKQFFSFLLDGTGTSLLGSLFFFKLNLNKQYRSKQTIK